MLDSFTSEKGNDSNIHTSILGAVQSICTFRIYNLVSPNRKALSVWENPGEDRLQDLLNEIGPV